MKFRQFWAMKTTTPDANAAGGAVGEIVIDGNVLDRIPWWMSDTGDTSSGKFRQDLQALGKVSKINLRINSIGGDLGSAVAIYNMLKDHEAETTAYVTSVAASAATIIAAGCDKVVMRAGTLQLIHNCADMPGYGEYMTAEDHATAAANLNKWNDAMVAIYVAKTGQSEEAIRAQMALNTWMSAEECKAFGLCDEIIDLDTPITATVDGANDSIFAIDGRLFDFTGMPAPVAMLSQASAVNPVSDVKPVTDASEASMTIEGEDASRITVAMIAARFPELAQALREEGIQAERTRNLELDDMLTDATAAIVTEARKAGTPVADVAKSIIVAMKASGKGAAYLAGALADANASGANGVVPGIAPDGKAPDADYQSAISAAKRNVEQGRI